MGVTLNNGLFPRCSLMGMLMLPADPLNHLIFYFCNQFCI